MQVVLGIITNNNKVLIGKLKQERLEDFSGIKYIFPGGKVKGNETTTEAITREVFEETGLVVRVKTKIASRMHPKTSKEVSYFHCVATSGGLTTDNKENDDIEELLWITKEELGAYMPSISKEVKQY